MKSCRIEIEYQQAIDYKAGVSLHYPMTITPRYAPPMPRLSRAQRDDYLSSLLTDKQSAQETQLWEDKWDGWLRGIENQQLAQQTIAMIKDKNDPDLLVDINVYFFLLMKIQHCFIR